jgi:hypothetical protein
VDELIPHYFSGVLQEKLLQPWLDECGYADVVAIATYARLRAPGAEVQDVRTYSAAYCAFLLHGLVHAGAVAEHRAAGGTSPNATAFMATYSFVRAWDHPEDDDEARLLAADHVPFVEAARALGFLLTTTYPMRVLIELVEGFGFGLQRPELLSIFAPDLVVYTPVTECTTCYIHAATVLFTMCGFRVLCLNCYHEVLRLTHVHRPGPFERSRPLLPHRLRCPMCNLDVPIRDREGQPLEVLFSSAPSVDHDVRAPSSPDNDYEFVKDADLGAEAAATVSSSNLQRAMESVATDFRAA